MRSMRHVHCVHCVTHLCYRLCPLLILANGQRRLLCAVRMWHVSVLLCALMFRVWTCPPIGTMGNWVIMFYPLLIRCRKCKTYECILVSHLGRCHRSISSQTVNRTSVLIQYMAGFIWQTWKKHHLFFNFLQ